MDIKKTDVFGGIGVFVIQMIANGICYAFEKNNMYLHECCYDDMCRRLRKNDWDT